MIKIKCDYCSQYNDSESLHCGFCGAPVGNLDEKPKIPKLEKSSRTFAQATGVYAYSSDFDFVEVNDRWQGITGIGQQSVTGPSGMGVQGITEFYSCPEGVTGISASHHDFSRDLSVTGMDRLNNEDSHPIIPYKDPESLAKFLRDSIGEEPTFLEKVSDKWQAFLNSLRH